jgi:hypothetical protein
MHTPHAFLSPFSAYFLPLFSRILYEHCTVQLRLDSFSCCSHSGSASLHIWKVHYSVSFACHIPAELYLPSMCIVFIAKCSRITNPSTYFN